MFRRTQKLATLGLVVAAAAVRDFPAAQAQQFSAELVSLRASGETIGVSGKILVAEQKVRIETPDLPDGFFVVDSAIPAAYLVRPAQRVFMEARQSSRITRLFVPLNPADPCRQWQIMAKLAGLPDTEQWHCSDEGRDKADGRDTLRYRLVAPQGNSIGWIDTRLRFPLKIVAEDGAAVALRHIVEAPQSASQFEIPADYRKFDPLEVIDLLKRTDIWVEPVHE